MTNDDRGYGPDDMGDDEQDFKTEEFERSIEDPPDDLEVAEDDDDDAEDAYAWAERHPAAAGHDGTLVNDRTDKAAEEAAVQERRPR